ncbi:hypothetical protein P7M16_23665, partial [Vibrio parahaemolyticus]|nr:hypothetical protein [Vibrio parahaemolyticus]
PSLSTDSNMETYVIYVVLGAVAIIAAVIIAAVVAVVRRRRRRNTGGKGDYAPAPGRDSSQSSDVSLPDCKA